MARGVSTGWRWALSAVALAACSVDERQPGIAEQPTGSGGTEQRATLGAGSQRPVNPVGSPPSAGDAPSPASASGMLVANADRFDFGVLEVEVGSSSFSWVITNTGEVPTGTLSLVTEGAEPFRAQSACPAFLPAGSSCVIEVSFAPTYDGTVARNVQFGQAGQMLRLLAAGTGRFRLNVQRVGLGSVTESSNGLTCTGNTCTGLFDHTTLTLSARTQNGSGSFFTGWSLAECAAKDDCRFDLDGSRSITATFQEQASNLIFVTSSSYPSNLGGTDALDAECNRVASAAGINSAAGNDFIAAVSSSSASLRQRLGAARGWVRRDGLPVGDTLDAIFNQFQMMYPPSLTEHGVASTELVMTGSDQTGALAPENCNDWTSLDASVSFRCGNPRASPRSWLGSRGLPCGSQPTALYCMGIRRSTAVTLAPISGKRIWITADVYLPGSVTPDAFCQSHRPAGVAQGVALLAYTGQSAAAVLDPNATYVRPDGALVGRGSDIAKLKLVAGPWLSDDGANDSASSSVWGGAPTPADLADPDNNCNDWRSAASSSNGSLGTRRTRAKASSSPTAMARVPVPSRSVASSRDGSGGSEAAASSRE
jgi:hypothetical protein